MLEAIASAMPGVGFVIGGVVAEILDPRASFIVAGAGVLIVLAAAVLSLRNADWKGAVAAANGSPEPDDPPPPPSGDQVVASH